MKPAKKLNPFSSLAWRTLLLCVSLLAARTHRQVCALTNLIPDAESIVSSENPSSISVLKTHFHSSSFNSEISFFMRFKILKDPGRFANLLESVLRRGDNDILLLFKIRLDTQTSKIEIETQETNSSLKTFLIHTEPLATGQWHFMSLSFDFSRGNAGIYVALDDLQRKHSRGRYAHVGANPDLEATLPHSSTGEVEAPP